MTSNQIAYAGVLVDKQGVEETQRHNREMERIEDRKNDIQDNLNSLTQGWKQQEIELKTRIQDFYEQWMTAQESDKYAAEINYKNAQTDYANAQASYITQKQMLDQEYAVIAERELELKTDWQQYEKQYKDTSLFLEDQRNKISKYSTDIEAMVKIGQLNLTDWYNRQNIALQQRRLTNEYMLGVGQIQLQAGNLQLQNQKLTLEHQRYELDKKSTEQSVKESKSRTLKNYFDMTPFNLNLKDIGSIIPFLGGM